MPKTKEALNKLVCEMWHTDRCIAGCNYPPCYEVRFLVDNLISNGVTIPVRCKDCRFCKKHPTSDKVKMCTNEQQWVTECYPLVHDDDFCSYGERKDNDQK